MKVHCKLSILILALGALSAASLPAVAADPATAQINAEIARLQQSIKDMPIADKDAAQVAAIAQDALKSAAASASSGQVYLALEKLGQAQDFLYGARKMDDKAEVEKGGLDAFQSAWNKVNRRLTALDKDAHAREWNHSPLAVRALAEAAQGKAIPLLEGGQGFAVAKGPKHGLLYVGEAEGLADFATFCASLTITEKLPRSP